MTLDQSGTFYLEKDDNHHFDLWKKWCFSLRFGTDSELPRWNVKSEKTSVNDDCQKKVLEYRNSQDSGEFSSWNGNRCARKGFVINFRTVKFKDEKRKVEPFSWQIATADCYSVSLFCHWSFILSHLKTRYTFDLSNFQVFVILQLMRYLPTMS